MQGLGVLNLFSNITKKNKTQAPDISTKLKFISMIQKGEKVDVKTLSVQRTSLWNSIWRMFQQESRDNTLDFLTATVNRAFEIMDVCLSSHKPGDITLCSNMIRDIAAAVEGLCNISVTYANDRLFVCNMQTLIQCIEVKIKALKESNPELFSQEKDTPSENTVIEPDVRDPEHPFSKEKKTRKEK